MTSDDIYNIDKPLIKDGQWLIFPNTTVSDINTMDCNDTMSGECYNNKSIDQCIQACEKSPECDFGYFISTKSHKEKNICVPLRDSNIHSNPIYRVRKQSIYPELNNTTSTVFINKHKYPFPPEDANVFFYMDKFIIYNVETKSYLETLSQIDGNKDNNNPVSFDEKGNLFVQAITVPLNLASGVQYVPVRYGDPLIFNIPKTTLVMTSFDTEMRWDESSLHVSNESSYTIVPVMEGKNNGDIILYSDHFAIKMGILIFGINHTSESNIERLYYKSYKDARLKNENVTFKFIPKMKGWYCNNDAKCTEIPLEQMQLDEKSIGRYEGLAIGRNPGCWGVCKYKIANQPRLQPLDVYTTHKPKPASINIIWFIILPIIILLIIMTIIIFIKKH